LKTFAGILLLSVGRQVIGLPRYSEDATRIEAITHKPTVTFEKSLKTVLLESTSFNIENWDFTWLAAPINTLLAILIKVFCKKGENYSKEFSFKETFVAAIPTIQFELNFFTKNENPSFFNFGKNKIEGKYSDPKACND
jgi:hypothetical protein